MGPKKTIYWSRVTSPKGMCVVMATERGVCWLGTPGSSLGDGVTWVRKKMDEKQIVKSDRLPILQKARFELNKYFKSDHNKFSIPLNLCGTPFQLAVWKALQQIPFGEMRSYKEVAKAIGRPKAVRAVGLACGANPISIIVPCHRVIGRDGSLGGYGGGLPTKQWLLSLEREVSGHSAGGWLEVK